MCWKQYHIIFSTISLKSEGKISVQKEVIHCFKKSRFGHVISYKLTHFKKMVRVWKTKSQIWPTNGFLKAKSSSFHFHKNDVTWPLSAKSLFDPLGHLTEHWQENWPCYCWDLGERFVSINRLFPKMDESSTTCDKIVSAWFGVTDGLRTDNGPNLVLGDRDYLER